MSNRRSIAFVIAGGVLGALLTALLFFGVQRCNESTDARSSQAAAVDTDTTVDSEVIDRPPESPEWKILSPTRNMRGKCDICGQIFADDNTPLQGAVVRLRLLDEPWETANVEETATTDENGRYCIRRLTDDAVYQLFAWNKGYAVASYEEAVCGAATDLYLEKGAALELKFVDEKGYSVPYVEVHLAGSSLWPVRRALSDERGRLKVNGLPEGMYSFSANKNDLSFLALEPIVLAAGEEIELEAQLTKVAPIRIQVQDAKTKQPISSAVVTAVPQNESMLVHTFITDDSGQITIPTSSIAGTAITVFAPGFEQKKVENIHPGASIEVFLASGTVIRGKVQTPAGEPIEGAVVDARIIQGDTYDMIPDGEERSFIMTKAETEERGLPQALNIDDHSCIPGPSHIPLPEPTAASSQKNHSAPTTTWLATNSEGEFSIDAIPTGQISLGATHPKYVVFRRPTVDITPGAAYDNIPILMKLGATLSLRVVSALGHPVSDAAVTVFDMDGQILKSADTGSNGYAEIEGLPEQFRIQATATGHIPGAKKIFGPPGQEVDATIKLDDADKTLRGRVVNRLGTGIAGVSIEAELLDKGLTQVLTGEADSDGSFALEGAGEGVYLVRARIDGEIRATASDASYAQPINLVVKRMATDEGGITTIAPPVISGQPHHSAPLISPSSDYGSGDSLGVHPVGGSSVAVTSSAQTAPALNEPTGNSGFVTGSSSSAYGQVDDLAVTGPPAGIGVVPIRLKAKNKKIVVTQVQAGSLVDAAGVKPGAELLKIDSKKITGVAMANNALQGPIGSVVMIDFMQDDEPLSVVVQRERK
ncbi:MAG: carboxypeptidase regulatory-like domain-containing protein [Deltaproteobacteria bacterium]|nr:carboxypeptidase regulatory-like domain-containing protein [Deltaproteobacteria bacterium]MBN2671073.1 carboxypeptidase regulatory-like domain-containing protein [Deltaproteobacteria bacterium]